MAVIYLNEEQLNDENIFSMTVYKGMEYLLSKHINERDVISNIEIDGVMVDEKEEKLLFSKKIKEFEKITFILKDRVDLVKSSLKSSGTYIEKMIAHISILLEKYHENKADDYNQLFLDLLDQLNLFFDLMVGISKVLKQEHPKDMRENVSYQSIEKELVSILKKVMIAKEKNDLVLVNDLIEYELTENLRQWKVVAIPYFLEYSYPSFKKVNNHNVETNGIKEQI